MNAPTPDDIKKQMEIIEALKERMGFRKTNPMICRNCKHYGSRTKECILNAIEFSVEPTNTCSYWGSE